MLRSLETYSKILIQSFSEVLNFAISKKVFLEKSIDCLWSTDFAIFRVSGFSTTSVPSGYICGFFQLFLLFPLLMNL